MTSIYQRLIDWSWFVFKCSLVAAAIGAVLAYPHLFRHIDEEIRRRVETRFAEHYPGMAVKVRSAALIQGKGIEVRDVSIANRGHEGPEDEILHLDEVFLTCSTDLEDLLKGDVEVTAVAIRRPTLRAVRRADGTWNVAELLRPPRATQARDPDVQIEGGTIELVDAAIDPARRWVLQQVQLSITAAQREDGAPLRRVQGTASAECLRRLTIDGAVALRGEAWGAEGSIEGLEIGPEIHDSLPQGLLARLGMLRGLRGEANVSFRAGYEAAAPSPYSFSLLVELVRGRLDDPRLSHPLTEMQARVICNPQGYSVERLTARSGSAELSLRGRGGFAADSPQELQAEVRNLVLDAQLADLFPPALGESWRRHSPEGTLDAAVKCVFDGRAWRPEISAQFLDVSFTPLKYPFRLEHARGEVTLRDDVLAARLTAYSGGQPIQLRGSLVRPLGPSHGWVEVAAKPIELDRKLLAAMPEKLRQTVRAFEPRGAIDLDLRTWRSEGEDRWHYRVSAGLNGLHVRHRDFPYPLRNLRGQLEGENDHWTFRNLTAENESCHLTGQGSLRPTPEGSALGLDIHAADMALDEALHDALPPGTRQVWNEVKPKGSIDVDGQIAYLPAERRVSVSFAARPRSENSSIQPACFPYRLEKLQGAIWYQDGRLVVDQFRGEHGNVRVWSNGHGRFDKQGTWEFWLTGLRAERLRVDRELVQAVPGRLKRALMELNPTAPVNVRGDLGLSRRTGSEPVRAQWNLSVDFQQGAADIGVPLTNLSGSVTLVGDCQGERFQSHGQLAIDSLMYKDFQFTNVSGPFWMDGERLKFGSWIDTVPGQGGKAPSLSGRLAGGGVQADGWVAFGEKPWFVVHAAVAEADLAQLAWNVNAGQQNLRGRLSGSVELRGSGRSVNALAGHGRLQLRDAEVREVPLMIALLKKLSVREPDKAAFSRCDIAFRIQENHVYFDELKLRGDAVSLVGTGDMNFQSKIHATLHAQVGRGELNVPVLRDVLGGASRQIMLVRVNGTLQNPEIVREPFPGVAQALQQFNGESRDDARRLPRK